MKNKHGQYKSSEYRSWKAMRGRCNNPNNSNYGNYGGRGIKVCSEWNDFETFLRDMGPKPDTSYSIERIDSDGNYEKDNCKWASFKDQQNNRTNNHWVEFDGEEYTLSQMAEKLKLDAKKLQYHLSRGRCIYDIALNGFPKNGWNKGVEIVEGKTVMLFDTIRQASKHTGVEESTLRRRCRSANFPNYKILE